MNNHSFPALTKDTIPKDQTDLKPLQRIGILLQEARQKQSLSIEQVAKALNLGEEQLIALEAGQENLLPEQVFIKAMVKRIAEKVKINPASLLLILEQENKNRNHIIQIDNAINKPKEKKINSFKLILFFFSILIGSGLVYTIQRQSFNEKNLENVNLKSKLESDAKRTQQVLGGNVA